MIFKEGDRVRFTENNLGAFEPISWRPTDTTVGDGDEGWYVRPYPEWEDWHVIRIEVRSTPGNWNPELVPAHESMFVMAEPKYAVVDTKDVPIGGQTPVLGRFATQWEAEVFIDSLPECETGRYGLDGP